MNWGRQGIPFNILKPRSIFESCFTENINILKLTSQMGKLRHTEMKFITHPFLANKKMQFLFTENLYFFSFLGHEILSLAFHRLISRITACWECCCLYSDMNVKHIYKSPSP